MGALGLSGSLAVAASYDFGEGRIWGFETTTGREKWSLTVPARVLAPPMIDGGIAYFLSTRELIGVALDSGRIVWRLPPGAWARDGFSDPQNAPLIAGGRIFASDDRSLAAIDLSAAKTAWTFTAGQSIDSSPLESGGTLFVRAKDGFLYALRADTGKLLWKTKLKEPFHSGAVGCAPLALVDGVLYAGTDNGQLFAIDPKSGSPLWIKDSGGTNGGPIVREGRIFIAHGPSVLCLR